MEELSINTELMNKLKSKLLGNSKFDFVSLPIIPEKYHLGKTLFYLLYDDKDEIKLNDNFLIKMDSINTVIEKNDKNYLHIFFTTKAYTTNSLDIILRFSNTQEFDFNQLSDWDLNFDNEQAYFISSDGKLIEYTKLNQSFKVLKEKFEEGAMKIIEPENSEMKATYYITYEMKNIKDFNGFEQDITLELGCTIDTNNKFRLNLFSKIRDTNKTKKHPYPIDKNGYEGYYDLGTLHP
ncbi:MAG: hypothetical protein QM535_01530 [Limnohabitans sp.]|nr:hypothetical protein [Limnohabitans sp.]